MIRATIDMDPARPTIVCEGHAKYGPRGMDIVCAMVSITMQALDARLMELGNGPDGSVIDEDVGYMLVAWEPEDGRKPDVRVIEALKCAETALRMVAEYYPKNVEIR